MRLRPVRIWLSLALIGASGLHATEATSVYLSFRTYYPEPKWPPSVSGTQDTLCAAVRNPEEWQSLWAKLDLLSSGRPQPPRIDFQRNTLLVVSLGHQDGACPEVFIESVDDTPDSIVVIAVRLYAEPQPCPGDPDRPAAFRSD